MLISEFQRLISLLFLLSALLLSGSVAAVPAKELTWQDLVPPMPAFEDPFKALSPDQLSDLGLVVRVREQIAAGRQPSQSTNKEANALEASLIEQGIDIEGLLARRAEITEKRRMAAESLVTELNGKQIRMPGYLLPLGFDGTKVTEFLLVPFVGACIHVPPPPPNQIVYVRFDEGYADPGIFSPVWVEGRMRVGGTDHELYLVDGSADVSVGYDLTAVTVEPYKK